jgi:pimeloyl-ACP methyl ester carboxylesterase
MSLRYRLGISAKPINHLEIVAASANMYRPFLDLLDPVAGYIVYALAVGLIGRTVDVGSTISSRWAPASEGEMIMPDVHVNGIQLAYAEQGAGQPVVFVHGGSGDQRVWENQLQAFGSKYRAIAVSCRGYYPSSKLQENEKITLDTFVEDLVGFVRALELAPVHLVGHSSPGGYGSLLLAHRQPTLLRSLTLIEPPVFPLLGVNLPPQPPQIVRLLLSHPQVAIGFISFGIRGVGPARKAFVRGDDEAGLRAFMKANLGSEAFASMSRSRFQQAVQNIQPLKAQIRAGFPPFREQDVEDIRVPTLLVSGENSNAVLRGVTARLQELLPNVERLNIKGASHNMFESHPQAFNKGVLEFIKHHSD